MAGLTGTLIMTVCVMLAFANAAAVSVTVKAVVTVAGAVYVTPAVVEFDSVPQLLTGQLVRLHRTPAFNGPPVTVAVKFAESRDHQPKKKSHGDGESLASDATACNGLLPGESTQGWPRLSDECGGQFTLCASGFGLTDVSS